MPQRLIDSTVQQRQALRAKVPPPLPWLARASGERPDVVAALRDEDQRHQVHAKALDGILKALPSVEAFAEPLLREALRTTFGLELDVRRTFLFNAARARLEASAINSGDPVARAFSVVKAATQSLLIYALQNFEASEAEEGGMRDALESSKIFISETGQVLAPGQDVDLAPERFAALCRSLDLGGQYQRLIDATFHPQPVAGESARAATMARQAHFMLFEQSAFRLNLHLASLRGWIDEELYEDLLSVAQNRAGPGCSSLRLWDVELNGIVLFPRARCLAVYLPDEPAQPLRVFKSLAQFHDWLRERLQDARWRRFFLRFVPARERGRLLQRLQRTLYPKVWNPGGWYEERLDEHATLDLGKQDFRGPLFKVLLQRKIAVLKDDGLFHAVPTAMEDHKSREDKIRYFLEVGLNVLNVAAFVVPVLGEVMLGVNAALLGYEVYEGFDSLAKGEREEAWGYFMDVAENLALMAAMAGTGNAVRRFEGHLPMAVRSMRPVTLADGSVRLWKPDLTPFAYDIELPAGLQPGENGLYAHEGRQWLALDGRYYSVRTLMGEQGHALEHPERIGAYEPMVRPNGNGGWLHELDTPQHWRGMQLLQRLGPLEAGVSETMALRALRISGVSEAQLRQALMDHQRPPALLTDTLRRLSLADGLERLALDGVVKEGAAVTPAAFAFGYGELQPRLSVPGALLQSETGPLPSAIIEEMVTAATASERDEMTRAGRVPLRLIEEARVYRQQVRLARACEGLYLDMEANADSAILMLHGLQGLPGWPAHLRLALYDGSPAGRLLTAVGRGQGQEIALSWDKQLPQHLRQALFDALPIEARESLGLDDAAALASRLRDQPLAPRHRLREWLGMPPLKPGFRSPMRLADGRIGYPLSGRGVPFFTEDELLDRLRVLELDDVYAEDALQALYRHGLNRAAISARLDEVFAELQALREFMDRWTLESARETLSEARQRSREEIGNALWRHWRGSILPELGRPAPTLVLAQVQLADLPERLPAFLRERVRALQLDEVILREGTGAERVIGAVAFERFARQFPELTSLDIRRGEWTGTLVQHVVLAWPRLVALGLRELDGFLGYHDLLSLGRLSALRRLELRGSRLVEMSVPVMDGVKLDYLGLDWLGLREWPQWLGRSALAQIGEVSLASNHLNEMPRELLDEVGAQERPTRVVLRNNPLGCQALLDLRVAEYFRGRFTFDLGIAPEIAEELNRRLLERIELQNALRAWSEVAAPSSSAGYRQRIARLLLGYWREDLYLPGTALLYLEDLVVSDFPDNLPPFFAERVRRLELTRFDAAPGSLERFLAQFPQLAELSLVGGQPGLTSVPAFLTGFAHLRELALVRMGMTIDQAAMDIFGRMPQLTSLQLDGNRLGEISDVSMFSERQLDYLGLAQMQIETWPAWIEPLLPRNIELLGLDDNLLTELPALLLENHFVAEGSVDISLRNNPLTRDTLIQAYTSQHYNRPYTLTMDLPEDIALMDARVHSSDSEASEPAGVDPCLLDQDPASTWQSGDIDADARHQLTWSNLASQDDAATLLQMVSRLRHSAEYRALNTRRELVARVWTVLTAAEQDVELRQTLDGMAQEPLQQLHTHDTCPDGIRLEFNQMELLVHTRQALREVSGENRGAALFRLMRGVFRAQALDRIARERAGARDEAEVRLAYRLHWGAQLELPLPPRGMLYRSEAEIAPGELDQALSRLQQEENRRGLLDFATACEFWVAYLREAFAERFKALKEAYEAAVLETTDLYPDDAPEQSAARIRRLEDRFKHDERALLEQLTQEQARALN